MQQLTGMDEALGHFKKRFKIVNESYHYTPYSERMATDSFVKGGGASMKSKAHSTDFHLKMRISTKMYLAKLPIFGTFDFDNVKSKCEPILYNFSRTCVSWEETRQILLDEALSN
jgi:hypothetical protein